MSMEQRTQPLRHAPNSEFHVWKMVGPDLRICERCRKKQTRVEVKNEAIASFVPFYWCPPVKQCAVGRIAKVVNSKLE